MIKVLQVGLTYNPGGMENCVINYYRNIDRSKFKFYFVDNYGKGLAFEEEIEDNGDIIYYLPNVKQNPFSNIFKYTKLLMYQHFDIIHINMLSAANMVPVIVAMIFSNAKIIVHSHSSSVPSSYLKVILNFLNLKLLRKLNVQKFACGKKAGYWMWGDEFDTRNILPNAIDLHRFCISNDKRSIVREYCGFRNDDVVLGFVGRICEEKNPLFLLRVLRNLVSKNQNYKLLIVGDGNLKKDFLRKIDEYGLEKNVFMAGVQNDVVDWYQAMDCFLLPSLFEGLPVVAIEAQAMGLPCLFSENITREIKLADKAFFLPINDNFNLWIEKIIELSNKPYQKPEMPKEYDITFAVKKLEEIYTGLSDI